MEELLTPPPVTDADRETASLLITLIKIGEEDGREMLEKMAACQRVWHDAELEKRACKGSE